MLRRRQIGWMWYASCSRLMRCQTFKLETIPGETPLLVATRHAYVAIAKALVAAGADTSIPDTQAQIGAPTKERVKIFRQRLCAAEAVAHLAPGVDEGRATGKLEEHRCPQ